MRVGSLFSGIGGLDLGLERAGMTVVWQSEIDPYASRVLAKHWPHVPNLGDITTVDWSTVEPVDLICGGYPCQPFSLAGVRRGEADPRHLWPHFARAIRHLRPRYALLENVPGHLSMGFGRVLGELAESGYDTEWDCIPAAAVGAPHLRYRVFVIATDTDGDGHGGTQDDRRMGALDRGDEGAPRQRQRTRPLTEYRGPTLADTDRRPGQHQHGTDTGDGGTVPVEGLERVVRGGDGGEDVADTEGVAIWAGLRAGEPGRLRWGRSGDLGGPRHAWAVEPDVCGMAPRLSEGLDGDLDAGPGMGADGDTDSFDEIVVRILRQHRPAPPTPHRRGPDEQLADELVDALRAVSHPVALGTRQETVAQALAYLHRLRQACEAVGAVRDTSVPLAEAWQSLSGEAQAWAIVGARRGIWHVEWPDVPRVSTGIPRRTDRLRCLGNAVVPQVAEWIGHRLMEADK